MTVPIGILSKLSTALTMLIILPQFFALSIPIPPAKDKPIKHKRTNVAILSPKIEPTLAGPYSKPRASGKAKTAIATIPMNNKKALTNCQIATRINKSGLFIILTSFTYLPAFYVGYYRMSMNPVYRGLFRYSIHFADDFQDEHKIHYMIEHLLITY